MFDQCLTYVYLHFCENLNVIEGRKVLNVRKIVTITAILDLSIDPQGFASYASVDSESGSL